MAPAILPDNFRRQIIMASAQSVNVFFYFFSTSGVIEMAKPEPPRERVSNETEEQRLANGNTNAAANDARGGHPAYYFLLPLTVPFDIATFPIQAFFYYGLLKGMH
jgi:hypothetical protein